LGRPVVRPFTGTCFEIFNAAVVLLKGLGQKIEIKYFDEI
jgi:hypothetical protein